MTSPIINNLKMNTSPLTMLRILTICDCTFVKWNFPNDQRFLGLKNQKWSMLTLIEQFLHGNPLLFEKTELTHSFLALTFRWYLLYCFNSKGKNILLYDILILQQLFSNHYNCYITTTPTTTPTATTILLLY